MKNQQILYGVIGFFLGAGLVWFLLNSQVKSQNQGMMGFNQTSPEKGVITGNSVIDAHFIEQMIPHHEDAITMANMALLKAKTPEIKQLAQNIIDSQSKEIEQMKSWYKNWYGRELPTGAEVMNNHGMSSGAGMHMGRMNDKTDIDNLENAQNFDKVFIEEMIPHHQMAVMMASMLKNGTQRPEMKQLADDIVFSQSKEIEQMRSWYKDWGYANENE